MQNETVHNIQASLNNTNERNAASSASQFNLSLTKHMRYNNSSVLKYIVCPALEGSIPTSRLDKTVDAVIDGHGTQVDAIKTEHKRAE